jgi:hypothetical protein
MSQASTLVSRSAAPERLLSVLLAAPFLAQMDATIAIVALAAAVVAWPDGVRRRRRTARRAGGAGRP